MKSTVMKRNTRGKATSPVVMETAPFLDTEDRINELSMAGYYKSTARRFMPSQELDAWLDSRTELDLIDEH